MTMALRNRIGEPVPRRTICCNRRPLVLGHATSPHRICHIASLPCPTASVMNAAGRVQPGQRFMDRALDTAPDLDLWWLLRAECGFVDPDSEIAAIAYLGRAAA